jgi:cytochrome c biogenesis protein CcmG/thiol:disulfide interchange protein DsbE
MKKYALPLVIFLVIVGFLAVGLKLDPREVPSPYIGKAAPDFRVPKLHEPDATISPADMNGRVWLLNVWASWCVSCRAEHEVVTRLARTGEVPVIGLNYKDEREDAIGWLKRLGNPYEASAFDLKGDVGIDWGVYGVPETFVIDQQGVVRHKHIGPITEKSVSETILPLVRKLKGAS